VLQVLHDSYTGGVGRLMANDCANYTATLFASFGGRLKDWMTFTEP